MNMNTTKKYEDFEKDLRCLKELQEIKLEYIKKRYVFINGFDMKNFLIFFGAKEKDFKKLQYSSKNLVDDPTLEFRKSRNGRFLLNFEKNTISRLEYQPFVLDKDEDFVRHDSATLRQFRGIEDNVQLNSVFLSLMRFQAFFLDQLEIKPRKNLNEDKKEWVSTIFHLRTITNDKIIGEPAKEGVHSDGVEHTMTTLLDSFNMTNDSAKSQLHSENQKNGIDFYSADKNHVVGEVQHKNFLDTLLIVDSELKHSVSSINQYDKKIKATRDMLIFFTRRPKNINHTSYKYDSLQMHFDKPIEACLL